MVSCHVELTFPPLESTLCPIVSSCSLPPPLGRFSISAANIVANQVSPCQPPGADHPGWIRPLPAPLECWQSSCVVRRHHRIGDGRWCHIQPSLYSMSTFGLCCCGGRHASGTLALLPLSINFFLEPNSAGTVHDVVAQRTKNQVRKGTCPVYDKGRGD
jgi:hypothetical protein